MTAPDAHDELRRAMLRALCLDHGHDRREGGMNCRTCKRRVDAILALPELADWAERQARAEADKLRADVLAFVKEPGLRDDAIGAIAGLPPAEWDGSREAARLRIEHGYRADRIIDMITDRLRALAEGAGR